MHARAYPRTLFLVAVIVAASTLAGCIDRDGPEAPPLAALDADPIDRAFKIDAILAGATDAEEFGDTNPFSYQNPLR